MKVTMVYHILVASYTESVFTLAFDPVASSLEIISSLKVGHRPSWITSHPGDSFIVFAGLEQTEGRVVVLKYDERGQGKVLGSFSSGGRDPASLLATKDTLFVGNVRPCWFSSPSIRYINRSSVFIRHRSRCAIIHPIPFPPSINARCRPTTG